MQNEDLVTHTADIAAAYVSNNNVAATDVPKLVQDIHQALASLGGEQEEPETKQPAVSIRASVKPDYLVCLECGAKQKTLKKHLRVAHGMSPDEYRRAYALPSTYPMVAAEYADRRRELAKQIGLGRKKGEKVGPRRKSSRNGSSPKT